MNDSDKKEGKVLIVEDETQLNDAYSLILKKQGYEVESAVDGKKAIEILETFNPDIVLLDLRMPNLDGIGFLKDSKFSINFPDTPVIVFTNFDENDEITSAFELGATRYVLKSSIAPSDLVKLVGDELSN